MLISLDGAAFGYGDNLIFGGVTFALNEGERTGLIGANGEGKTTLIKLMLGELEADAGEVRKKNGLKCGYLEQNGGYTSGNTVFNEMRAVFKEEFSALEKFSALSAELSNTPVGSKEYTALCAKIEALEKYVSAHDCYNAEVKIKTVLNGLGFSEMYERVVDTMSGGEKTRLKLARLLLEQPDLLILDEPTNHLDLESITSLNNGLTAFKGCMLLTSHDQELMNTVCNRIIVIDKTKVYDKNTTFDEYVENAN